MGRVLSARECTIRGVSVCGTAIVPSVPARNVLHSSCAHVSQSLVCLCGSARNRDYVTLTLPSTHPELPLVRLLSLLQMLAARVAVVAKGKFKRPERQLHEAEQRGHQAVLARCMLPWLRTHSVNVSSMMREGEALLIAASDVQASSKLAAWTGTLCAHRAKLGHRSRESAMCCLTY